MRQYSFTVKYLSWVIMGAVSLLLYGCTDPDPTVATECDGRTGTVGGIGVQFASYMPECSQVLCRYNSEFIYGVGSSPATTPTTKPHRLTAAEREYAKYETYIESFDEVPYGTGALVGARFVTTPISPNPISPNPNKTITSSTMVSDGRTLKFLGYGYRASASVDSIDSWYSSDANCGLEGHPLVWSFGRIFDGEIRSNTDYDTVTGNEPPYTCDGVSTEIILTKIADVTLGNGQTYKKAVIFYYLYGDFSDRRHVTLSMDGVDIDLGELPTSAETKDAAVWGLDIYAKNLGWIAGGEFSIDANNFPSGTLQHFSEFTGMTNCL